MTKRSVRSCSNCTRFVHRMVWLKAWSISSRDGSRRCHRELWRLEEWRLARAVHSDAPDKAMRKLTRLPLGLGEMNARIERKLRQHFVTCAELCFALEIRTSHTIRMTFTTSKARHLFREILMGEIVNFIR